MFTVHPQDAIDPGRIPEARARLLHALDAMGITVDYVEYREPFAPVSA